MSLRLKINLLLASVIGIFVLSLLALHVYGTRESVEEEIEAANRVANQLLSRVTAIYASVGPQALTSFLERLGRVRATEIRLLDADRNLVYQSPPSPYKKGRDAPAWYAALVSPRPRHEEIPLASSLVIIDADASRAVLDGWDKAKRLLGIAGVILVLGNGFAFWLVGRATRPFQTIHQGLEQMERGDFQTRLPPLPGAEAGAMSAAFNRMATVIEENLDARREAAEAQARAKHDREMALHIQTAIEEERRSLARELHDEMSQGLTAIKSVGMAISRGAEGKDPGMHEAASLIVTTAGGLYDGMHNLIPRLRPVVLDDLGLMDAVEDMVAQWRSSHPKIMVETKLHELPEDLGETLKLAAYRIIQESVTNALRHAAAQRVTVEMGAGDGELRVCVTDDGRGLPADWQRPGHYGMRGMQERAEALGGRLELDARAGGGTVVAAVIPLN